MGLADGDQLNALRVASSVRSLPGQEAGGSWLDHEPEGPFASCASRGSRTGSSLPALGVVGSVPISQDHDMKAGRDISESLHPGLH